MHPILHNSYYFYKYIFMGAPHLGTAAHKTGKSVVFRSNQGSGMLCMPVSVMSPDDGKNRWYAVDFPESPDYSRLFI
jgi:hypothetical protein